MRAVLIEEFGGPEQLIIEETPQPEPTPEQLLVRVKATALNRADILQRRGLYPPPPGESDILGLEIAGEVVAVGNKVTEHQIGDRVFGLVAGGGYAEYCVIDQFMAWPIPNEWTDIKAAAVPEVFLTANETLFILGELQSGETMLIHAGASGVGSAAVQMAKHIGATVFFTAGSDEKIAKVKAIGGDVGINYKTTDFAKIVMDETNSEGVDVVEDFGGADYFARNMEVLKTGGRLVIVAYMTGPTTEIDFRILMKKRLQIKGSTLRSRSIAEKREVSLRFCERWMPELHKGSIKPIIDSVFSIKEVKKAHQYMEANQNFGKIIMTLEELI